jgi:hypothetical protein
VASRATRTAGPDGKLFHRVTEVMMPNLRIVASPFVKRYGRTDSVAWTLPIDDTTTKIFTLYRTPRGERVSRARFNGKSWAELTEEEHQRMPHDYEAQVGQGAITLHSEERLAASDRGVVMFRRLCGNRSRPCRQGAIRWAWRSTRPAPRSRSRRATSSSSRPASRGGPKRRARSPEDGPPYGRRGRGRADADGPGLRMTSRC